MNNRYIFFTTQKSRVSGYQSLKVCNENNHECNIEKNKGISHRKVLETEVDSLNLQVNCKSSRREFFTVCSLYLMLDKKLNRIAALKGEKGTTISFKA